MIPTRWMLVAAAVLAGSPVAPGQSGRRGADPKAVAEVEAGTRTEARASWWGFDPEDATAALQAAIDSGAARVIVEDMGTPWIVEPIRLAGDQEIVFEEGTVVQAKRGSFRGKTDCLFTARSVRNLTLRGPGATLRMWREDYDDPARYTKSEWRHALSLLSCANVRISGLTLAESGGDGIYLGQAERGVTNTDVVIEDVVCARNYRQGISVITARGLRIERCILRDTAGTAPMAGIDFEPNVPAQCLVDCVMRDCVAEGNAGTGYQFSVQGLGRTSTPVSIRLENCRGSGNRTGLGVYMGNRPGRSPVRGTIEVVDCRFEDSEQAGIAMAEKAASGCDVRFRRCVIADAAVELPDRAPIEFRSGAETQEDVGGVAFDDCTVIDPVDRLPIGYSTSAFGVRLVGLTGTLAVEHGGRRAEYTLDQDRIDAWLPSHAYRRFPEFSEQGLHYRPVSPPEPGASWACDVRQRGHAEFLLWAEAGAQVAFTIRPRKVGTTPVGTIPVTLFAPDGRETDLGAAEGEADAAYRFRAGTTGAYRVVCEAGPATVSVPTSSHPVCLHAGKGPFHLLRAIGELSFWVPEGVAAFGVRVAGGGGSELVRATLRDPSGRVVGAEDAIEGHQFVVERPAADAGGVWSLRLDQPTKGVLEDVFVQLQAIPPVLAPTRAALLKPAP